MKDKDTISKGPKRRDETCYQVLHDIVIPSGTILRNFGKPEGFTALVAHGDFVVLGSSADSHPELYRKVIA